MSFARNQWYVAAYGREVGRELLARTVLGEPLVLYRTEAGEAVVLADRCVHRRYPLSQSRLDGDTIVCGYHGFTFHAAPDVTLEQDLARRDLTINAMARGTDGRLVDPFGGQRDVRARVLRHVSPAFAEDPVRILRVARFAARFTEFHLAPETLALMRRMVDDGEVDHLVAERVWQEIARGLMKATLCTGLCTR